MFETQSLGEPSSPRRFHLVSNEVQEGVVTPQQPPAEMESTSTEPHVEIFQPDETFSSSPVSTQPDDFLQAQEVIQAGDDGHAREAIQIRYSRCANCLSKMVVEIDEKDSVSQCHEEAGSNQVPITSPVRISAQAAGPAPGSIPILVGAPAGAPAPDKAIPYSGFNIDDDDEDIIIAWEENDPENPYNWSGRKKNAILATTMLLIVNSTMGSSLPSNAIPFIAAEWQIESEQQKVLPISVYLVGYILGPILWAPLSEQYGRRRLTLSTFFCFAVFTMACALAPNWPVFLVFRLLGGVFASAPIAIVPGIIADTHGDPRTRGRSMGLFFATTLFGPLLAPIVSGYSAPALGWRWAFWIGLMYAGATMAALIFLPETFGPVLLLRRTQAIRKQDPTARVVAVHELEKKSLKELTTVVLMRPIHMIIFEPIVNTSCAYLALVYAIFYMSFGAYPIIFQDLYHLSPGECGLTYLAIGVGCLLALPIFFAYDNILRRAQAQNAPWTRHEESRRLPLACIGGPMFVVSLFWLGWTAREPIHFVVPMLAGIPFGLGFMCIFQALLNYLTDAYEIFAASANAAASCSRSLLATVLPLATAPMFARLGIAGACSLLGGFATLMCIIPFLFLWQGERIRANSQFCIAIRQRREEMAARIDAQRKRRTLRESSLGGFTGSTAVPSAKGTSTATPSTIAVTEGKWNGSGSSTPAGGAANSVRLSTPGQRSGEYV